MKHFTLKNIAIYAATVLTPIYAALFWLGILIFFDLITGLIKARRKNETITSHKLKDTMVKTIFYFVLIISAQILDSQYLSLNFLPAKVAQLAAGYVAVIEFKSILENTSLIIGKDVVQYLKEKMSITK